ncbi:MAG: efflux RND transporter periplasmic adaptor subunit [Novosphingobium sp.]
MAEADVNADIDEFLGQEPGKRRPKWLKWAIGGAILLFVLLLAVFLRSGASAPRYATESVARGDMVVYVSATGNLEPTNEVTVGSELSGLVSDVFVDVNDRVTRGQALAQIDIDKLVDQVRRSSASLAQSQAQVAQGEASVRLSQAQLGRLEEVRRLSGGKVPSQADIDTGKAQYQRDLATLASARASVASAAAQLATDKTNLGRATLRSPVNGVILSRQIEVGQTVAASFNAPTLFVIAEDLTKMKLEVKVDEADVGQVKEGQEASFSVDAYPDKTFAARIVRVNVGSNTASSGTTSTTGSSSNVVSYGAVLSVANPELALRPGMTAMARILASKQAGVLMVPNAALRYAPRKTEEKAGGGFSMFPGGNRGSEQEVGIGRGSTHTIYVLGAEGKPRPVRVKIGDTDGARTIVTGSGVTPGMKVVTGELAPPK